MPIIYPLKDNWWRPDLTKDEIRERVRSEDWYTQCKGFPLLKVEDIKKKKKHEKSI